MLDLPAIHILSLCSEVTGARMISYARTIPGGPHLEERRGVGLVGIGRAAHQREVRLRVLREGRGTHLDGGRTRACASCPNCSYPSKFWRNAQSTISNFVFSSPLAKITSMSASEMVEPLPVVCMCCVYVVCVCGVYSVCVPCVCCVWCMYAKRCVCLLCHSPLLTLKDLVCNKLTLSLSLSLTLTMIPELLLTLEDLVCAELDHVHHLLF